jgi:hypothetical protein
MKKILLTSALALAGFVAALTPARAADSAVKLTKLADRVRVEIDGQLFTEYVFGDGATRPYCYPVLAKDGTSLTRDFPQKQTPGEETDHKWHRSIWFAHSYINNVDFWNEAGGDVGKSPKDKGNTVNDGDIKITSGKVGTLVAHNKYVAPDGRVICTDERTLRFHADAEGRYLDYELTIKAPANESVLFGDNKDGTMAIRLAQWMTTPHKAKGVEVGGKGKIITSTGFKDNEAWGKRADWCDYYSEKDGKTYGIAIFDNPQNLRHPTWWMARPYGLFGANPFGQRDYETTKEKPITEPVGNHTVPAGGTLTLKYRMYFHNGDEKAAKIADKYAAYAAGK